MTRLLDSARKNGTYKKSRSYTNKEEMRKKHKRERLNRKRGEK